MELQEEIKKHANILHALATTFETKDAKREIEKHLTLMLAVHLDKSEMIKT